MSVADKMLKEIVTLAKKLAVQEHENKSLWDANMQIKQVRDLKAQQCRETEQELQRLRRVHMEFQSEELTEARATIADLQQQLDSANAAVTHQRSGIERQRRVVDKVRKILFKPNREIEYGDINGLRAAITTLDGETPQPAPVAEPAAEGGQWASISEECLPPAEQDGGSKSEGGA